jgi:N-sulfoglucosamine sulfohydrolase
MTNVVYVHTDNSGRYVEPYGYDVPTPAIQSIAEDGLLFRQAISPAPTCSPSRGAMMSGCSPHSNGLNGLAHLGFSMDDYSQHLVRFLGRNGYETALCGQQHEANPDGVTRAEAGREILGYDRIPADPGSTADFEAPHELAETDYASARAAAEYIREDHAEPYFLSVGLDRPHIPFPRDDPDVDPDYVRPPEPIPDVPEARRDMAGYITSAGFVDDCVEHVYDALVESGDLDDTLFVFTTDHGIQFKNGICDLFETGIGVAMIARFPDGPRGEATDALVSQIDLFPTFCDYLGLDTPDYVEGTTMRPLIRGEVDSIRSEAFSEVTYHAAYEPKRCVRTDRYKYIRRFDEDFTRYVLPNIDDTATKEFLLEHGLADQERPREALYDLYHDPQERDNLVDDPDYADVYDDLTGRLEGWMEETDDPLLDGPVPKPEGASVRRRENVRVDSEDEPQGIR